MYIHGKKKKLIQCACVDIKPVQLNVIIVTHSIQALIFLFILKNTATCAHSCFSLCMHACACANINSVYDISDWSVHMPHFQSSQCFDDPSDLKPPHT